MLQALLIQADVDGGLKGDALEDRDPPAEDYCTNDALVNNFSGDNEVLLCITKLSSISPQPSLNSTLRPILLV